MDSESNICLAEVVVKVLHVLRDIIPLAGTGSTKKVLNALSPLLASVELDMRSSICDLLDSLAKADPSVFPVVYYLFLFSIFSERKFFVHEVWLTFIIIDLKSGKTCLCVECNLCCRNGWP